MSCEMNDHGFLVGGLKAFYDKQNIQTMQQHYIETLSLSMHTTKILKKMKHDSPLSCKPASEIRSKNPTLKRSTL